jgi:hypothetical protein
MRRRISCVAAAVVAALLLRAAPVHACSCFVHPPQEALAEADTVFAGRVQRVEDRTVRGYSRFYHFDVGRMWKGESVPSIAVASVDSAACGFDFEAGQTYLVFADWWQEEEIWTTGWCAGTQEVDRANEYLTALGSGWVPAFPWLPPVALWPLMVGAAITAAVAMYAVRRHRLRSAGPDEAD